MILSRRFVAPAACLVVLSLIVHARPARAADVPAAGDLVIARDGHTAATIIASPDTSERGKRAGADLARYVERMAGARPAVADTPAAVAAALSGSGPVLVVGRAALDADPTLRDALAKVAKPDPVL